MTFISITLATLAVLIAIPVAVFLLEVVAAVSLPQQRDCSALPNKEFRPRVAVLVPAHNESIGLLPTLADIKGQLRPADRLLVVADNCTDDTAAVAVAAGADVCRRNDPDRKGKGYALAWGLRQLHLDPPDIVIILDADCRLADGAIAQLTRACAIKRCPVQALDLMIAPKDAPINYRVMEFAWRVKNWVRPLGLKAIGLPCQLMGTGMAFPWDVICSADLASGSLVEDLKLGLELTLARNPPLFCPSAIVTSEFPLSVEGVRSQRIRWEQGHIGIILTVTPRLTLKAIRRANVNLLALSLDAAVPPLSLLGMLALGMVAVSGLAILLGVSAAALVVSTASVTGFLGAISLSWLKFGRDIVPLRDVLSIGSYIIKKLPLYCTLLFRNPGRHWIRTDRRKV